MSECISFEFGSDYVQTMTCDFGGEKRYARDVERANKCLQEEGAGQVDVLMQGHASVFRLRDIEWSKLGSMWSISLQCVVIDDVRVLRNGVLIHVEIMECTFTEGANVDFREGFQELETLSIIGTNLDRLEGFPSGMEQLHLSNNRLRDISGVAWPPELWQLDLCGNCIETLDGVVFPHDLHDINLGCNAIRSFSGRVLPKEVHSMIINLKGNPLTDLYIAYSDVSGHSMIPDIKADVPTLSRASQMNLMLLVKAGRARRSRAPRHTMWVHEVAGIIRGASKVPVSQLPVELCRVLMQNYF